MLDRLEFWISPSQVRAAFRHAHGPDDEHTRFFNEVLNSMSGSSLRVTLHDDQIESIITGLDVDSRQDRRHDIAAPCVEMCDCCGQVHEVRRASVFGGTMMHTCPDLPENTFIKMERAPNGRLRIAGLSALADRQNYFALVGDGSAPELESVGAGPVQTVASPTTDKPLSLAEVVSIAKAHKRHFGEFPRVKDLPFTGVPALLPASMPGHAHNCPGCALPLRACDGLDCGTFIVRAAQACADNEFTCGNCGWSGMPSRALIPPASPIYCLRCGSTRNTKTK